MAIPPFTSLFRILLAGTWAYQCRRRPSSETAAKVAARITVDSVLGMESNSANNQFAQAHYANGAG